MFVTLYSYSTTSSEMHIKLLRRQVQAECCLSKSTVKS